MLKKLFLVLALPLVTFAAHAETGDYYLKEGIVAFKQGRFQDAVAYFNQAKQKGVKASNLSYNIGASYYKLNQYRQARKAFLEAAKDAKFQQFAWYNLGLVERKLGNNEDAVKWFRKASEVKGNKRINALATQMIQQLSPKTKTTSTGSPRDARDSREVKDPAAKPSSSIETKTDQVASLKTRVGYEEYVAAMALDRSFKRRGAVRKLRTKKAKRDVSGGIDLALGHDSDVESADTESPLGEGSMYIEALAYVDVPFGDNFTFSADIYAQNFPDVGNSDDNYTSYKFGLKYRHKFADWSVTPAAYYGSSKYGSTDYLDTTDFRLTFSKRLGKGKRFSFRYRYSDIDAADAQFNHYTGDRNRYRFEYKMRTALGKWRFRYRYETNDRQNTTTRDYSPTRHEFRARLTQRVLGGKWKLGTEVQFRTSEYDPTAAAGSNPAGFVREDDRFRFRLDFNRRMNKKWKLGLLWVHTNNDSNDNSDDYDKNDIQIYSSWRF